MIINICKRTLLLGKVFSMVFVLFLFGSCELALHSAIEGAWQIDSSGSYEILTLNGDDTFSWEQFVQDKNGESILDSIKGSYLTDLYYSSLEGVMIPLLILDYTDSEENKVRSVFRYVINGDDGMTLIGNQESMYRKIRNEEE